MQAATPSADRVARAKRRHPEWFPARHFDRLSSKVYFALGMTTAQCDAASADLHNILGEVTDAHDTLRRGAALGNSYHDAVVEGAAGKFLWGISVQTAVLSGQLGTVVIACHLGGPRHKEDCEAWRAFVRGAARVRVKRCANPACPRVAAGAPAVLQRCGRCRAAVYCGAGCQAAHWPEHKAVCVLDV